MSGRDSPTLVIGLMSGTSLDGVDAAMVQIGGASTPGEHPDRGQRGGVGGGNERGRGVERFRLRGFAHRPYAPAERAQIEAVLDGAGVAAAARLHAAIATWAGDAVAEVIEQAGAPPDPIAAIAFPGQTMWHQPPLVSFQLGEPAVLVERFGIPVVHNFRSRDVAAGGQGAPLVPMADALWFGAESHPRVLLNIGGMANATWVASRGDLEHVVAGDTGPGVAVIDAIARLVDPTLPFDRDGCLAAQGAADMTAVEACLQHPFFTTPMPRSTGREWFGREFAADLHRRVPGVNGVRTAVALTVESIARCCTRYLPQADEVVAAGGGVRHPVVMRMLADRLREHGVTLRRFDELFFASEAKEPAAFALLAHLTLAGQPGNIPSATGARGPRLLGSTSWP